jgi:hypothetical protein
MADSTLEHRVKVFISYSRADKAFASDLVLGLAACGFAPYIDRADIAAGEDWEKRLSGLIAEADTIVCVISPDSVSSQHCSWELGESQRLAKRVLPVVWQAVDERAMPPELKRLNYIFFSGEGRTFASGLAQLAEALRTDINWIREHTRIALLAQRWAARGRTDALLLRGDELEAAISWRDGKPIGATSITDEQADFIKASSNAKVEAERRASRAKAGLLTAVSVAAVVFAGLAGLAGWQWQTALKAEDEARTSRDEAVAANASLEDASLRLNADIGLRTAPSDDGYFVIDEGWYPVAANYSGAVARVDRSGGGRKPTTGSGFVIDGGLVHPKYNGQPLLLIPAGNEGQDDIVAPVAPAPGAASDTLPADAPRQPQRSIASGEASDAPVAVSVSFPALGGEAITGADLVWKKPDYMGGVYPFELWTLAGALPRGARMLVTDDVDCRAFETMTTRRTIGTFGITTDSDPGPNSVTLGISELLDGTDPYAMRYTHATNVVAYGAPVFDLATGDVFAIHLTSEPDPARPGRRLGAGISMRLILDMARQQIKDAQLPPVCGT